MTDTNLLKSSSQANLVGNEKSSELSDKSNAQAFEAESTSSITKDSNTLTPDPAFSPPNESKDELTQPEEKPRATVKRFITVEPTLFFTMFAVALQMNPSSSLMIDKICHVTYDYSLNFCKNYTNDSDATEKIQNYATDLGMYSSLVETIPAVLYSFFLGSWSDKHSRKIPIIMPIFGYLVNSICNTFFAYYMETPPEFLLIGAACIGFSGGMVSMMMGSFSYIADITTSTSRTKRIALADFALFVSLPIGMVLSSAMYSAWGYVPEYALSVVFLCVAIFYSMFFLTETVVSVSDDRKCAIFRDLFDIQNLKDNLKILTTKRPGNDRLYISLMLFAMFTLLFPLMGESKVMLLFVEAKFGWDQTKLGYYSSYSLVITAIGTFLLFRLVFTKFKLPDLVLGAIGVGGMFLKAVILAISFESWMLYVGATVSFFQFIGMPTVRSFSSKLVTNQEVGKLFAVVSSCEALSPIFSSVIYSQLYKATLDVYLGTIFILSASLALIPLIIFVWIHLNKKKLDRYKRFEDEKEINNGEQPIAA